MRRFRKKRQIAETILIGCVLLSMLSVLWLRTVLASTCVACHTDEAALKNNLATVVEKKSAMTSGAG